jgi:hypothetical protein
MNLDSLNSVRTFLNRIISTQNSTHSLLSWIAVIVVVDSMATPAPLGPPPDEAIYEDLQAVKAALQEHARQHGYSITVSSS